MEIQIAVQLLISLSIIGSSVYLGKTYVKENKRKNVASLKKYRIEILDGTLKKLNNINKDGNAILYNLEESTQNPNFNFEDIINQFLIFYKQISDSAMSYHQDFTVWSTENQKNILESIINIANQASKDTQETWTYNKQNPQLAQKDLPFFDDFLTELTKLVDDLRYELNNEIAQY